MMAKFTFSYALLSLALTTLTTAKYVPEEVMQVDAFYYGTGAVVLDTIQSQLTAYNFTRTSWHLRLRDGAV